MRSDNWRIKQFNRNRAQEDQVTTIGEMRERIKELFPPKYIYESPDGGKTIYKREFGDYNKKEKVYKKFRHSRSNKTPRKNRRN